MFGLPFPTYFGWIIWPVGMVIVLAIIGAEYKKYLASAKNSGGSVKK